MSNIEISKETKNTLQNCWVMTTNHENYEIYKTKVNRNVEGFVIAQNNNVNKYVRMKNGQLQAHHE